MLTSLAQALTAYAVGVLTTSVLDQYARPTVEPVRGSLLYCDLAAFTLEHSGIYIGHHQIVHLGGDGCIEVVSPEQFLARLNGYNFARTIYVACQQNNPAGNEHIARRAENMVGSRRQYNVLMDNCHQFSAGCLSGNFDNHDNYMWRLRLAAHKYLQANQFLAWNRGHMLAS